MTQMAETYAYSPGQRLGPSSRGTSTGTMNPKHAIHPKKPPLFTGPRERLSQMLVRIRQLEGNPHYIALGMAVGIFVSITPIIPLQTLVAVTLAFVVRGSKSAAALGTWLSNPLTIPLVYYANYKLGCILLRCQTTTDAIAFDSFSQLMDLGLEVTGAMLVGSLAIGLVLGVVAYFVTFRVFTTIRRRSNPSPPHSGLTP
jgi:uncharacterized protein (DUF2062 family)